MKQKRTNESLHAGQVQLPFMAKAPAELKETRTAPATAPSAEENVFRVVYPMINDLAFSMMMDNYRRYVQLYNQRTKAENALIYNHNQEVKAFLAKAPQHVVNIAENFPLRRENLFLSDREFNAAADDVNARFGPMIAKRPLHILKYTSEQFFQNFLHVYNTQLCKVNTEFIRFRITEARPLPALKINSYFITQLQRTEGVFSLNVCSKTVRNHRQRLEEAGVLINKRFRGHQTAVELEINPEILVVFDLRTNRITSPENQQHSAETRKTLPDNDENTGAIKEEYQEKNGVARPFVDKESAEPTAFLHYRGIYRFTGGKVENSPEGGAAAGENSKKNQAENLRKSILHPQELAEALAAGEFNDYVPIDVRIMQAAAYNGMISNEEYRELVIQDLLKQSAKIWRYSTAYAGSWKNAYNHWMKTKFLNFQGTAMPAPNTFSYLQEYRWRLERAHRWFRRESVAVKPLFPSDYFDTKRKTKSEIGFEGTAAMWQRKLKYDEKQPEADRKSKKKAEARLKRLSDNHKLNHQLKRYLNGKISLVQLTEFVRENLPPEFYAALPRELDIRKAQYTSGKQTAIELSTI